MFSVWVCLLWMGWWMFMFFLVGWCCVGLCVKCDWLVGMGWKYFVWGCFLDLMGMKCMGLWIFLELWFLCSELVF